MKEGRCDRVVPGAVARTGRAVRASLAVAAIVVAAATVRAQDTNATPTTGQAAVEEPRWSSFLPVCGTAFTTSAARRRCC